MKRGKTICKTLKEIRLQVARANDIPYEPTKCNHKGDCLGTCPACEEEVRYIERQLDIRRLLGKVVTVAGISAGLTALTACSSSTRNFLRPDVRGKMPAHDYVDSTLQKEGETSAEHKSMVVRTDTIGEEVLLGEVVETPPEFPGGPQKMKEFIDNNLRYPDELESDVQGRVIVQFMIERDGTVSSPAVVESLHPLLDKEALRVISLMPKWSPAKVGGNIVETRYSVPVNFKLK
ncbi:MAG: energy transducer TonB [Prevotella sp.]|nr:energy transducer TonB [Prevotella sp.]MBR6138438.1 energy transducer TonB [Prevotella sp.]